MFNRNPGDPFATNPVVNQWVEQMAAHCAADKVFWCDGSSDEHAALTQLAVREGILIRLNQTKLPGCYYHRSHPNDVARVEQCTYICTQTEEEAGPTNNWMNPREMHQKLDSLTKDSMRGRTMYVIPYLMGPPGSALSKVGIELTDSVYVVLSMRIMARIGKLALDHLGNSDDFNRGLHCMLDVNPDRRFIAHFPQENAVISVGSNYGGNVLLGKKCLALRIGSFLGRREGWLAEHMLILGVEAPSGQKTYIAAAFPSQCGKTNFAMMTPPPHFKDWKIWTIGDDIAWMKPGPTGRLHAINPESGYFGVAPGTNGETNANAIATIACDTIYTNVALTPDLDVWWEGKTKTPPPELIDWKGNRWTPESKEKAAHPNSRFTAPMANNPSLAPEVNDPDGVPISAIIFGGRRSTTIPLVYQAFNWIHGVYVGATMSSETTAAATGVIGQVRRDPMAMLPFCGYNMGEYFKHWLNMRKAIQIPPRIFHVNWFRKNERGEYLWPGFGENMRVLKWIVDRCHGQADATEVPLGWVPGPRQFDLMGMTDFDAARLAEAQRMNPEDWKREVLLQDELFMKLYSHLPKELIFQRELLVARL